VSAPGSFPVGGSPEQVAAFFGYASAAELEAAHEQYARQMTLDAAIDAEIEAQLEAEADAGPEIRGGVVMDSAYYQAQPGSPEHYAAYEKEFDAQHGIGFPVENDRRASTRSTTPTSSPWTTTTTGAQGKPSQRPTRQPRPSRSPGRCPGTSSSRGPSRGER
jgi:hypothetical protein